MNGELFFVLFDDAMISMRYARNLADGHGLVWNSGETPVEGYTNLLWTVWMAFLHMFGIPESKTSLAVMASGVLLLVVNGLLSFAIARRLAPSSRYAAPIAAALTVLYYPLIFWTLRGMEVGLIAVLLSAAVLLALRLRDRFRAVDLAGLAAVLALAVLTRSDAVLPASMVAAFVVATARPGLRQRAAIALGVTLVGTLGLHTGFRLLYYDSALPNTFYLKLEGVELLTRLKRGLAGVLTVWSLELFAPLALTAVYLFFNRRRVHPGALLLAGIFVAQVAYSVYAGGDAWEGSGFANRYVATGAPSLLILTALAIDGMVLARGRLLVRQSVAAALLVLPVLVLRAIDFRPLAHLQLWDIPVPSLPVRVLPPIVALVAFAAIPVAVSRAAAGRRPAAVALLAAVVLGASVGAQLAEWMGPNRFVWTNEDIARAGLVLRGATDPAATSTVVTAGTIPYLSHRPSIDLLGRSDPVIARRPSTGPFIPGHNKWDYRYSVERLRPDVVYGLWGGRARSRDMIRSWGYEEVGRRDVFVRLDSRLVDRSALARGVRTLGGD